MRLQPHHALLMLSLTSSNVLSAENAFENMLRGFVTCKTPDLYLDYTTHEPIHSYLRESKLIPYKIKDGFAYYRVKATYFGLPVSEFMIPASTWGVTAITFDTPINKARSHMKKLLGSEFRPSDKSEDGDVPELISNPKNKSQSVFVCNDPT